MKTILMGPFSRRNVLSDLRFVFSGRRRAKYIGWTDRGNMGDEFLYKAIRGLFEDTLSLYSTRRKGLLKGIVDRQPVEIVFLGGGTLISHSRWAEETENALEQNPKAQLIVFGTGVADAGAWKRFGVEFDTRRWVRLLNRADYVAVRGPLSREHLIEWGFEKEIHVIGDPVLIYAPKPADRKRRTRSIGVNIAGSNGQLWGQDEDAISRFGAELITSLIGEGWDVTLFPVISGDISFMHDILARAGNPPVRWYRDYLDVGRTVRKMALMDVFVGLKLHSVVMASCANVPAVMLEYRPKCRDFMRSIDREEWTIRTDELDAARVIDAISRLSDDPAIHQRHLAEHVGVLQKALYEAADTVKETVIARRHEG